MAEPAHLELPIDGMTCASCARRVETSLNRVDGVTARVNFATELASVTFDADAVHIDALADAVRAAGYAARLPHDATHEHDHMQHAAPGATRAVLALALAAVVLFIAMVPGFDFAGSDWVQLVLATITTWYCAWSIHTAAARGARHLSFGMDSLVSLGVLAAWGWSSATLVLDTGSELYFESAAVVAAFVLLGRWLESRAKHDSSAALHALRSYAAGDVARLDTNDVEQRVPIDQLSTGDRFVVRPGERIAADGLVESGRSSVDQSLVTGESVPVPVAPGDAVVGGAVNADGRLVVQATRTGDDTAIAAIGRLLASAQTSTAAAQRLADRISAVFVPIVLALAAATFAGWWALGPNGVAHAIEVAVAVLVIACPCALGLATPMALLVGTMRGARSGIVVSSAAALDQSQRIDTIVLDKTGTLTTGAMSVDAVHAAEDELDVLATAAAVEVGSEHPIARAIVQAAHARALTIATVDDFTNAPGHGATGMVAGRSVIVGRVELLDVHHVTRSAELNAAAELEARSARTSIWVAWDGVARGVIACSDGVRDTSAAALRAFGELGLRTVLVTGDAEPVARRIASALGIDDVYAGATPHDKVRIVRELQTAGRRVAMVGDGVNDAPALAQAQLGIAMGSGTDVAIAASDITLLHADPLDAARAITLARRTVRTIRSNLVWAFAYNVAALPLAVAGLVNPMVAGAAMACSSLFVVGNSLRLRRARLTS